MWSVVAGEVGGLVQDFLWRVSRYGQFSSTRLRALTYSLRSPMLLGCMHFLCSVHSINAASYGLVALPHSLSILCSDRLLVHTCASSDNRESTDGRGSFGSVDAACEYGGGLSIDPSKQRSRRHKIVAVAPKSHIDRRPSRFEKKNQEKEEKRPTGQDKTRQDKASFVRSRFDSFHCHYCLLCVVLKPQKFRTRLFIRSIVFFFLTISLLAIGSFGAV